MRVRLDVELSGSAKLAGELVVLRMGADPEPVNAASHGDAERAVIETDANAVQLAVGDGFELE